MNQSQSLKVIYVGCLHFSLHCLKQLLANNANVKAIFTLSSNKSNFHSDFSDLTPIAKKYEIPIHYIQNINKPSTINRIQKYNPDVILVWGWSQILKEEILKTPRLGCIGSHPALLPKNRGRHPLIWPIVLGMKKSGLTFFWLEPGIDNGPILAQKAFTITNEDDAFTIYKKIECIASNLIPKCISQLAKGTAPRIIQNNNQATYWRKRDKRDGLIDFRMSSKDIDRLVRALTKPYLGAHIEYLGKEIKIWKAKIGKLSEDLGNVEPGKVIRTEARDIWVKAGDGSIVLTEHEFFEIPPESAHLR